MLSVTDVRQFYLGVQGENEEQTITVDVKPWLASYPNGIVSIWHKRNGESVPTPTGAVYDAEEGTITWTPTYTDTYVAGEGEAEIRLYENGVIKKTRTVKTGVAPSVTGAAGVTLESGWQGMINYIDDVVEDAVAAADDAGDAAEEAGEAQTAAEAAQSAAEDAQTAAESAQTAAETAQGKAEDAQTAAEAAKAAAESAMLHYPYVDPTTGNWMLWNPETGTYVNTGIHAQGPTGTVPNIQIGTVTTLIPGASAYVTRRSGSTDEEPIFDFGLPKGDTGQAGNIYGNTIDMSEIDSTKVSDAIGAKADKVGSATSGNFAGLDSNGNLTDSGHKHSDYLTQHQDISGKQDKTDNSLDTTAKTVVGAINEHESDITSLNDKLDAYSISGDTQAGVESALVTFGSTMVNGEVRRIMFTIGTVSDYFAQTTYIGNISRTSSGRYLVSVSGASSAKLQVKGLYRNSAWTWEELALDSNVETRARSIYLSSSDDTLSKIWTKIDVLSKGETATIYINNTPWSLITNGARTIGAPGGTVTRVGTNQFKFILNVGSNNDVICASISGVSSSSAGTYTENDINSNILSLVPSKVILGTSGTSVTLTIPNGCRAFLIGTSVTAGRSFAAIVVASSQGAVDMLEAAKGSEIVFDKSVTNRLTITTTTTGTMNILVFAVTKEMADGIIKV